MAVREDEIAAAAVGVDTDAPQGHSRSSSARSSPASRADCSRCTSGSITPGYFGIQKSIEIVVMVTLGGLGSISGAILAAIVLTFLPEVLRDPPSLGIGGWAAAVVLGAIVFGVARFRRTQCSARADDPGRLRAVGSGPRRRDLARRATSANTG